MDLEDERLEERKKKRGIEEKDEEERKNVEKKKGRREPDKQKPKQKQNTTKQPMEIPEEIITEILSRLPAESVLKCRSVCKAWRTLTYQPSFTCLHLQHSKAAAKVSFISLNSLVSKHEDQLVYGEYDENNEQKSCEKLTMIKHSSFKIFSSFIVGSCNGLICVALELHDIHNCFYICNPITREYATIFPRVEDKCYVNCNVFGFGYHPSTDEYKVVRMYNPMDDPFVGRLQVCTVGDGNGWRNKKGGKFKFFGTRINFWSKRGILANGALHWLDYDNGMIVSLDLADEELYLIPSPPCLCPDDTLELRVLGGLLCAVVYKKWNKYLQIWSLEKNKNKLKSSGTYDMMKEQSWTWSLDFDLDGEDIFGELSHYEPCMLTKNREVLFWYNKSVLYRYDSKATSLDMLVDYAPNSRYFEAIPHINTFISLKDIGENANTIEAAERVIEAENN